jgi:hypothetical protein
MFMPILRTISTVAALVVLCACAGSNAAVKRDASTASTAQNNPACLKETGSRVPSAGASCSGFGRSYSSDDISRTGSPTVGGSLRLLDPSLTVH